MRRTYRIATVTVLAGLATITIGAWRLSSSRSFQFFGDMVSHVETSEQTVALTFDDGPTPEGTEEILSILRENRIKATFFVIGSALEQYPELGRKIVEEGHELGNHSYSHERMVLKTPSFIRDEIERTDELIRQTGFEGPINFRPPFGKKLVLLPYYLSKTHRKTIMWDIEPDSLPEVSQKRDLITDHVLEHVKPGSIVLLHVMYKSREESMGAVPGIISGLKERGYGFKTISELLSTK